MKRIRKRVHTSLRVRESGRGYLSSFVTMFAFFVLFLNTIHASPIDIESKVSLSEITIGDKFEYLITIKYPLKGTIELPAVLGNLGSFEVKDYSVSSPVVSKDSREQTWKFVLSTFTVGEYTLPPQIVEYTPESDTTKQVVYTEPIQIIVKRTTAETVKDIADITDLAEVSEKSSWWIWLLILIAIAAGIGLYIWRKKKTSLAEEIPQLPPYEEAIQNLNNLALSELMNGQWKAFCFKLSEILRKYFNRELHIDALESTTEEFLEKLTSSRISDSDKLHIKHFCQRTDLVKFADAGLVPGEASELLEGIRNIINNYKPLPAIEKSEDQKIEDTKVKNENKEKQNSAGSK